MMDKPENYTDPQWDALRKLYERDNDIYPSFEVFVEHAHYSSLMGCVMVNWCGMWIGIETDGYTHS
jgi:hypothetical protein